MIVATHTVEGAEPLTLINQPWSRVRNPVPIPANLGSETSFLTMTDEQFAELIRSNLMPREDQAGGRQRWTQLWALLLANGDLAERTFDALEDFLDATEEALADGLDEVEERRARKFKQTCGEAWKRLQRVDDDRPLAWAGKAADGFNPVGRKVVAKLVTAIAQHRSAAIRSRRHVTDEDRYLWGVLEAVQLDPRQYHFRERNDPREPS